MLGQRCHSDQPVLYFPHLASYSIVTLCLWWLTQREIRDMVLYSSYLLLRLIQCIFVVYYNLSPSVTTDIANQKKPLKTILAGMIYRIRPLGA